MLTGPTTSLYYPSFLVERMRHSKPFTLNWMRRYCYRWFCHSGSLTWWYMKLYRLCKNSARTQSKNHAYQIVGYCKNLVDCEYFHRNERCYMAPQLPSITILFWWKEWGTVSHLLSIEWDATVTDGLDGHSGSLTWWYMKLYRACKTSAPTLLVCMIFKGSCFLLLFG